MCPPGMAHDHPHILWQRAREVNKPRSQRAYAGWVPKYHVQGIQ
jgi:hypothetical protein